MMARSTKRSNQRPDTRPLTARSMKTSCNARPDHTLGSISSIRARGDFVRLAPDSVAKLFWAPERATLIQEQRLRRNIDSTNPSPRFDYCASAASCRVLQQNPAVSRIPTGTVRCQSSAMCGRLRVGKENLHVAGVGRCSHVFGLLGAVRMTAGHNALTDSGPSQAPHSLQNVRPNEGRPAASKPRPFRPGECE